MNSVNTMNRQPDDGRGAIELTADREADGDVADYQSTEGLSERIWVRVVPGDTPTYWAVANKLDDGGRQVKGFDLLHLRVAGVCVEVLGAVPAESVTAPHALLLGIPVSHCFSLAKEGVVCAEVPGPEGVPVGAWLCFAMPKVLS